MTRYLRSLCWIALSAALSAGSDWAWERMREVWRR